MRIRWKGYEYFRIERMLPVSTVYRGEIRKREKSLASIEFYPALHILMVTTPGGVENFRRGIQTR